MAYYQVRKWNGWKHNMTLVVMAMLFMLSGILCFRSRIQNSFLLVFNLSDVTKK